MLPLSLATTTRRPPVLFSTSFQPTDAVRRILHHLFLPTPPTTTPIPTLF